MKYIEKFADNSKEDRSSGFDMHNSTMWAILIVVGICFALFYELIKLNINEKFNKKN